MANNKNTQLEEGSPTPANQKPSNKKQPANKQYRVPAIYKKRPQIAATTATPAAGKTQQ
jgi:hypothetical protein